MAVETPSKAVLDKLEEINSYKNQRKIQYGQLVDQLDTLWHDIDAGKFGDNAKDSDFYKNIKTVKDSIAKPDTAKLHKELDAIIKAEK